MIARFREELETAPDRYRHLFWETGMIGQVLYLEAEAQGVRATGIGCFFDDPVHELMGLPDDAFQSLYHSPWAALGKTRGWRPARPTTTWNGLAQQKVRKVPQKSCQLPGRKGFSAIPELPRRDLV